MLAQRSLGRWPPPPVVFHGCDSPESRLCRRGNRAIARRVDATFGADKAIKHEAKLPGIDLRRYPGKQSDSLKLDQVQHAWRHSPPGPAMHSPRYHPWAYGHDTSGFPAASNMHDLSGRVISHAFVEAGWARRGNAELCSVYLIKCACWDWGTAELDPRIKPAQCGHPAACCRLHDTPCAQPVSSPATQLCDRGDLGKPPVIDKDILLPIMLKKRLTL